VSTDTRAAVNEVHCYPADKKILRSFVNFDVWKLIVGREKEDESGADMDLS
jgi:hypothetical protein